MTPLPTHCKLVKPPSEYQDGQGERDLGAWADYLPRAIGSQFPVLYFEFMKGCGFETGELGMGVTQRLNVSHPRGGKGERRATDSDQ